MESVFVASQQKTAWSTWKSLPDLTDALLMLANGPNEIPMMQGNIIEQTSACTKVDHARRKPFPRKTNSVQQIPPTRAALEEHVKRAVFQGGHIWGKTLLLVPVLPSSTERGWGKTEGIYEHNWTTTSIKNMPRAYLLWLQELLQKALQMQEGCIPVHRPLFLWGRMCQLTLRSLIYSNIIVPRHDQWEVVKLSRDQDMLIE